jgi:hypothetical protein
MSAAEGAAITYYPRVPRDSPGTTCTVLIQLTDAPQTQVQIRGSLS